MKKIFLLLSLLVIITSCGSDNEEAIVEVISNNDTVTGAILGAKRITIGNKRNENITGKKKKDSKGYFQEGTWSQSSLSGFKDSISRYSSDPMAQVTYLTSKLGNARYCVSVFRMTHPNSIDKASYDIWSGQNKIETIEITHALSAGQKGWYHLGEFNFKANADSSVVLSRSAASNNGFLRADEIRFKRLDRSNIDCHGKKYSTLKKRKIIDNRFDASNSSTKKNISSYRESGFWEQSSLSGYRNTISRFSRDESAFVTYGFKPQQDNYCLSIYRVTHPNSSEEVVISMIQDGQIIFEQTIDYRLNASEKGWIKLDRIDVTPNLGLTVKIERANLDGKILRADAVKLNAHINACN